MENLNIGRSGIEVPFLGMGTWAIGGGSWWGDNDDALSVKAIQTAVEQGIRWIDTAPIYGLYHSETVVGEALKHIDRDKVVLSTKCGLEWRHETPVLHKVVDGTAVYRDLSAQSIIEDVKISSVFMVDFIYRFMLTILPLKMEVNYEETKKQKFSYFLIVFCFTRLV